MKYILVLSVLLWLSGCASTFDMIATYHNNQDPCQFIGKPQGYKTPSFCYSGQNRTAYIIQGNKINKIP